MVRFLIKGHRPLFLFSQMPTLVQIGSAVGELIMDAISNSVAPGKRVSFLLASNKIK